MGGNSSCSKALRGVPDVKRTHTDTHTCVDGHKVLLQKNNYEQSKNVLNSNSESPIYLIAKVKDGSIQIHSVNVFKNHEISLEINLEYNAAGDAIPFSPANKKGSHAHFWFQDDKGMFKRKQHDKNNRFDIPSEYHGLINEIVMYNKKKLKWI